MGFFGTVAAILVALAIRDWLLKPAPVKNKKSPTSAKIPRGWYNKDR
jgi:hypothetical protein